MGHYPAWPGNQSQLRIACVFDARTGTSMVSAKYTIHDFSNAVWHNGAARTVTNTASIASSATTFTATNCTGATAWVNRGIGTVGGVAGIAARTFVKSISGACLVTLNKPTTAVIAAGTSFKIDNAIARSVADGVTTLASTTVTSATANFTATDVGLSFTGTNIPDGTTIATFVNASTVTLSAAATATGASQVLTVGASLEVTTTRTSNDAAITSATVINSVAMKWKADDVGLPVYGTGIPAGTYIVSVAGTNATTTGGMTVNAGPLQVTTGDPSLTAPTSTDTTLNQGVQLALNPVLVPGSAPCTADQAAGFGIAGTWLNPGSFIGGAFATQPTGTKAIGEIKFATSVITYGAYIVERPVGVVGDPIGSAHYDIVFPNVPTGLALCASASSPGVGYSVGVPSTTASQAAIPNGVGRPSTAQLRSTRGSVTGSSSTVYLRSDDGIVTYSGSEFERLCIIPAGTPDVNFTCGDG
jgi:hypothetical protein